MRKSTSVVIFIVLSILVYWAFGFLSGYSTPLSNNSHNNDYTLFYELYRDQEFTPMEPPADYSKWITYASERSCSLDLTDYRQIYKDLQLWMRKGGIEKNEIQILKKSIFM